MLKNISKLGTTLSRIEQNNINGGKRNRHNNVFRWSSI